jgi:hypothetical protein
MRGFLEERGQASRLVFDRKTGTFSHCPIEHSFVGHGPASAQDASTRAAPSSLPKVATRPLAGSERSATTRLPISPGPVRPAYAAPQPHPEPPAVRMSSSA